MIVLALAMAAEPVYVRLHAPRELPTPECGLTFREAAAKVHAALQRLEVTPAHLTEKRRLLEKLETMGRGQIPPKGRAPRTDHDGEFMLVGQLVDQIASGNALGVKRTSLELFERFPQGSAAPVYLFLSSDEKAARQLIEQTDPSPALVGVAASILMCSADGMSSLTDSQLRTVVAADSRMDPRPGQRGPLLQRLAQEKMRPEVDAVVAAELERVRQRPWCRPGPYSYYSSENGESSKRLCAKETAMLSAFRRAHGQASSREDHRLAESLSRCELSCEVTWQIVSGEGSCRDEALTSSGVMPGTDVAVDACPPGERPAPIGPTHSQDSPPE